MGTFYHPNLELLLSCSDSYLSNIPTDIIKIIAPFTLEYDSIGAKSSDNIEEFSYYILNGNCFKHGLLAGRTRYGNIYTSTWKHSKKHGMETVYNPDNSIIKQAIYCEGSLFATNLISGNSALFTMYDLRGRVFLVG